MTLVRQYLSLYWRALLSSRIEAEKGQRSLLRHCGTERKFRAKVFVYENDNEVTLTVTRPLLADVIVGLDVFREQQEIILMFTDSRQKISLICALTKYRQFFFTQ